MHLTLDIGSLCSSICIKAWFLFLTYFKGKGLWMCCYSACWYMNSRLACWSKTSLGMGMVLEARLSLLKSTDPCFNECLFSWRISQGQMKIFLEWVITGSLWKHIMMHAYSSSTQWVALRRFTKNPRSLSATQWVWVSLSYVVPSCFKTPKKNADRSTRFHHDIITNTY